MSSILEEKSPVPRRNLKREMTMIYVSLMSHYVWSLGKVESTTFYEEMRKSRHRAII